MGALGFREDLKLAGKVGSFTVEFRGDMFKNQSVPSDMTLIDFSSFEKEIKQVLQK